MCIMGTLLENGIEHTTAYGDNNITIVRGKWYIWENTYTTPTPTPMKLIWYLDF